MAIKIVVSDKVKFPVKGNIKNEQGVDEAFSFFLVCRRLPQSEFEKRIADGRESESGNSYTNFLVDVAEGWEGVKDAAGQPVPFTEDNLRALCDIPGVAGITYFAYLHEGGARAKN